MSDPFIDFDNPLQKDQVYRQLFPSYCVAAENVDDWKKKEEQALIRRNGTSNPLSWIFWQVKYLSAVGNGAEAERCRDSLFDPHWGCISKSQTRRADTEASTRAIQAYNRQVHGI